MTRLSQALKDNMINIKSYFLAIVVSGLALCPPAGAFNTQFLDDAPIARFNNKDIEIWLDALTNTLENGEDGVEVKWENPKTGHNGTLTPLNKKTHDGMDCRDVDIRNFAGDFTGRAIHLMCRKDGKWLAITN